jgi:hypothetical protein
MKFRTIFILFNIVLVFSFSFIFFMPFFLLGADYSLDFWAKNWPLASFFLLVLSAFNAFFIYNWKLFMLVEGEDWDALSSWLKNALLGKGRFNRRFIRLYVNSSLLRSDMEGIEALEAALRDKRPALLAKDAVLFGAARLLKNDPAGTEAFLKPFLDRRDVEQASWLSFYYAFTLILLKRPLDGAPRLKALAASRDPLLSGLAAYLLGSLCAAAAGGQEKEGLLLIAKAKKAELKKRFSPEAWSRETEKGKAEVHIVILSKLIDDAGAWLLADEAQ